ncbi:hypothetical protein FRC09_002876, partial [Ceratobasidium sp. 395]
MFDAIQEMEGERGLESVVSDIDRHATLTLDHVLQGMQQWGSVPIDQAVADEDDLLARIDAELKILDECNRYHVLGLEKQWELAYTKAKTRDEADLEEKLLKIAEEALEPEEPNSSTAMERLADEGFRRSDINRIHTKGETETDATVLELKTLSQRYNESVHATASYQPPAL